MKDITGQRFGRLVAVRFDHLNARKRDYWLFRCDCGTEKVINASSVQWGGVKSCGCLSREHMQKINTQDITGQRFGRLTALHPTPQRDAAGSVLWQCRCDCGNRTLQSVNALRHRGARSCGCLYRESRPGCIEARQDLMEDTSVSALVRAKSARSDSTSGCTGVSRNKKTGKWTAYINFQKKRYILGNFSDFDAAVQARKQAERILHDPYVEQHTQQLTAEKQQLFEEYRRALARQNEDEET